MTPWQSAQVEVLVDVAAEAEAVGASKAIKKTPEV
jgi:hypothetical protein